MGHVTAVLKCWCYCTSGERQDRCKRSSMPPNEMCSLRWGAGCVLLVKALHGAHGATRQSR